MSVSRIVLSNLCFGRRIGSSDRSRLPLATAVDNYLAIDTINNLHIILTQFPCTILIRLRPTPTTFIRKVGSYRI